MSITHKYTIICDDVRREDNGKMMLIGVYNDKIVVPQIPFQLPTLTFFIALDADRPGNWMMKFRIEQLETRRPMVEGHAGANITIPGPVFVPIKFAPLVFQALGDYSFWAEIEGLPEPIVAPFALILPSQIPGPIQFRNQA
jgi:hypothetical protein